MCVKERERERDREAERQRDREGLMICEWDVPRKTRNNLEGPL